MHTVMALFQNPFRKDARTHETPAEPDEPDDALKRQEQLDEKFRFMREQDRRRAASSIPPPGVERLTSG